MDRMIRRRRQEAAREMLSSEGGHTRVKLCGMFRDEDIAAVNEAAPDMVGFIGRFPKSHRNVSPMTELGRLSDQVNAGTYSVLVQVDVSWQRVAHSMYRAGCADIVQLHGGEDEEYIRCLRLRMRDCAPIIQAFRIREHADVERALASSADMVLLDAGQGSGERFNWELVADVAERRPFMLAGGLTPENVAEAIRTLHPWGVDLSSGIETNRVKDPQKMAAAVAAVREER